MASCDEAVSSICDATHEVKVLNMPNGDFETVGLYNKCKCDFWVLMCEHDDTKDIACDYAAEYCCGDYEYSASEDTFYYLNSPACYCDFQKFEDVKPQTMNVNSEFIRAKKMETSSGQFSLLAGISFMLSGRSLVKHRIMYATYATPIPNPKIAPSTAF